MNALLALPRILTAFCLLGGGLITPIVNAQVFQQDPPRGRSAVIIPFHEDINPLSGSILQRKFQEAIDNEYDVVILDIDSPGGRVDVTFDLMDMVLDAKEIETVAMIEHDAISGAALLSLACDKILIRPGARLGDAGVIVMGLAGEFRYAEAKSRSLVAQKARDTAKATNRPEVLAEKMTDKDMVVFKAQKKGSRETKYISDKEWETLENADQWEKGKPLREAGKEMFFITNGERLVELGMADHTFNDRSELGDLLNVRTPIDTIAPTWAEQMARFMNTWYMGLLLITIGLIGLGVELSAPGISVGGLASVLCFGLFFWSRFAAGTSGWLEVMLFVMGLVFIACEIFVIPGFGIAGLGGITLVLVSLVMASQRFFIPDNAADLQAFGTNALSVLGAFVGFLVAAVALSHYMGDIPGLRRLTLQPPAPVGEQTSPLTEAEALALLPGWQRIEVGERGKTVAPLRPSGRIQVGDYFVDVVTEGDFIDTDVTVQVIAKQGARVVVRAT